MSINIKQISIFCINHYFLLSGLMGLLFMFAIPRSNMLLFVVIATFYIVIKALYKRCHIIDLLIIGIIVTIILSSLLHDYPSILLTNGINAELLPMLFFIVGRDRLMADNKIFYNAVFPIIIVCICGLFLFFSPPAWYIAFRTANLSVYANERGLLEMTRLSAFWEYPYWVSYGVAILYYFLLCESWRTKKMTVFHKILFLFLLLVLVLAQQRGPMLFVIGSTVIFLFLSIKKQNYQLMSLGFFLIIMAVLAGGIIAYILTEEQLLFLTDKYVALFEKSGNDSFLQQRADIFSDFYKNEISLLGDGLGMYSHMAYSLFHKGITDQQYLKMIYETGILGFLSRISLIVWILLHGVKSIRIYYFEVGIIILFLFTMFGANSLATEQMHNWIFWLCCGRIYNRKLQTFYEKKSYSDSSSSILSVS